MADLPSASELTRVASLLAPGAIIMGIRSRFNNGEMPSFKDSAIGYGIASTAYYAAISPIFHVQNGFELSTWVWGFLQYFLLPCIIAILIIYFDQKEWFYKVCQWMKLEVSHHIPTAWDRAFRTTTEPRYVIVRLSDGKEFYGTWQKGCFVSTTANERDLYLKYEWDVSHDGIWSQIVPERSVLICSKDISSVEFI